MALLGLSCLTPLHNISVISWQSVLLVEETGVNNSYKPFSGLCFLFYLYILICIGICIICDIYNIHTLSANICKQKKGARENDELF
jgi:hypothetical protein